jgi:hypothetical protein
MRSPEEASFGQTILSQEPAWRRIAPTSTSTLGTSTWAYFDI